MDLKISGSSRSQLAALASKNAASIATLHQTGPLGVGLLGMALASFPRPAEAIRHHRRPGGRAAVSSWPPPRSSS